MLNYYKYFALLLPVLLASCMTSFRISVQKPAAVDFPNDVEKVAYVENSAFHIKTTADKVDQMLSGDLLDQQKLATQQIPVGMSNSFTNGNWIAEEVPAQSINNEDGSPNWTAMDSIFARTNSQALIVVEQFKSKSNLGGVVGSAATGTRSYLYGEAMISAYCKNRQIIQNYWVGEYYYIPTSGSLDPAALLNDALRKREYYKHLGYATGYKAAALFYPVWVWAPRDYYNKGSKGLRQAKPMIHKGNWDLAEKKLLSMLDDRKHKVRGRAHFNLGLVYEGQGRIDDAIEMIEKAALDYNIKKANSYLQTLRKRKSEVELIEWQMWN